MTSRNEKEVYHDEQLVYLWQLNHEKDIDAKDFLGSTYTWIRPFDHISNLVADWERKKKE